MLSTLRQTTSRNHPRGWWGILNMSRRCLPPLRPRQTSTRHLSTRIHISSRQRPFHILRSPQARGRATRNLFNCRSTGSRVLQLLPTRQHPHHAPHRTDLRQWSRSRDDRPRSRISKRTDSRLTSRRIHRMRLFSTCICRRNNHSGRLAPRTTPKHRAQKR